MADQSEPVREGVDGPRSRLAAGWERLVTVKARDEEEARLGRLFNTLMVISTGIVAALSADFLLTQPLGMLSAKVSWIAAAFPLAFIPLSLFCLIQSRRGHVQPMVRLYAWVNLIAIGVAAWLFDGIYSPAWPLFIWTITVAGTLLTPAYALWLTGGVVLYFGVLLLATEWSFYVPPLSFGQRGREFVHMSVVLTMLVSTVGLLTYLNMRSLREALEKLRNEIAARKQTEEHLRQSEERYRSVVNNAGDIIFTMSREGTLLSLNPAFQTITGWTAQEWRGHPFNPLVRSADLPRALDILQKTLREEAVGVFEMPIRKKSGDYFIGEITVTPLRQDDTPILLGICRDVTERKRMEDEIRHMNEELELKVQQRTVQLLQAQEELVRKEKLAVLGQVAGSVGHELRNPLGVMNNAVYFLQTVLADANETTREYLTIIKNEIAASERIVSDLLDSVRTTPPRSETVAVQELIEQTLAKCSVPPSVSVKLDVPATLPPMQVDALQIMQVLRNLIGNGVEAMPHGGILQIRAEADEAANKVFISVSDSGSGIAPENMPKLFTPLFTTKARGIGLGLVVVRNLIQANCGKIEVQSELGKGTTFTVALPCIVPKAGMP